LCCYYEIEPLSEQKIKKRRFPLFPHFILTPYGEQC
jgi:hypothetical protein